ncbi:hypothetical protein C922_05614 [Plasmodium inui San Antonio 1]|uniref:Uncharacterized protein n=1 Tax=Plasmodium inui San Antonio 1 TaxID=1237626 RepID=W6ZSX3_9APIC|nr:hypothetical protein C922_05614 [Plasmodium inui San Antonio 1]EUD64002.1 hypothetical protein C922_05614 [Plasmodium inui San Antonio 1]
MHPARHEDIKEIGQTAFSKVPKYFTNSNMEKEQKHSQRPQDSAGLYSKRQRNNRTPTNRSMRRRSNIYETAGSQ